MKTLKSTGLSLTLIAVLATVVFAGETPSPPYVCGETSGPPCPAQSWNDAPVVPGETLSPPALPVINVTDIAETVMWALSLF